MEPNLVQFKKGVLELCVLALLSRADSYGYDIASRLSEAIDMGEGTIYPLMRRMQKDGLVSTYFVESSSGPPRKYYALTEHGRQSLNSQRTAWTAFTKAVHAILGSDDTAPAASTEPSPTPHHSDGAENRKEHKGMNSRQMFLDQLRAGLKGLPRSVVEDILAEYTAHFDEGRAAGRSDGEIAAALGDPGRLAREVRAETGVRRWEDERSLSNALGAIVGILGLAALDLLVVLPVLMTVGSVDLAFFIAGACICLAGSLMLPFALINMLPGFDGDWLQGLLISLGMASGGASIVAVCALFTIGTLNLLIRYGRAHYRLIAKANPS